MNGVRLRNPYEIPLYIISVLVNLLIIGLILYGALLLGYVNALAGSLCPVPQSTRYEWPLLRCCSLCRAWSCIGNSPARAYGDRR